MRLSTTAVKNTLFQAAQSYLYMPNISLIDFGFPEVNGAIYHDDVAIRFHVYQKLRGVRLETAVSQNKTRLIPKTIGQFRTDVIESTYRPTWFGNWGWQQKNPRMKTMSPLQGGISLSNEFQNSYGTLGGVVQDKLTGDFMILSNWHVLVGDWFHRPKRRIFQPGRLDGGTAVHTIARLSRHAMSHGLDAAVARLENGHGIMNYQYELGSVQGAAQSQLGLHVVKSGRKTAVTHGQITGILGQAVLNYAGINRKIDHVLTITNSNGSEVSESGDSGSFWLNAQTHQAVGLHFAGGNLPERALAMEMPAVLQALNVIL